MKYLVLLLVFTSLAFAKPASEDKRCSNCISFVDMIYDHFENEVNNSVRTIDFLCTFLPDEKIQKCKDGLGKKLKDTFENLRSDLTSKKACQYMNDCESNGNFSLTQNSFLLNNQAAIQLIKSSNFFKLPSQNNDCEQCKSYFDDAYVYLEEQVLKLIKLACSTVPEKYEQKCIDVSKKELETDLEILKEKLSPTKICEYFKYC